MCQETCILYHQLLRSSYSTYLVPLIIVDQHVCGNVVAELKNCQGGRGCLGAEGVLRVSLGCFVSLSHNGGFYLFVDKQRHF